MKWEIRLADLEDREKIYQLRHDVYASEIHQHPENPSQRLTDKLDAYNEYIIVRDAGSVAGFISITPPGKTYSIDKYIAREDCPFVINDALHEIRLLTVAARYRGLPLAGLLMYAAFRWIDEMKGETIIAIGRREVMGLYKKIGMNPCGKHFVSGQASYELMVANVGDMRRSVQNFELVLKKYENSIDWNLNIPFRKQKTCYHGGAFFKAIGEEFDKLHRKSEIINADVLDAWFSPAPNVLKVLQDNCEWTLRTSPPTHSEGLIRVIADTRKIPAECLLAAGGSSALIYLALGNWLNRKSRVLILDPCYGEYLHFFENVAGCQVEKIILSRENGYRLNVEEFLNAAKTEFDLIVIVNPANPTGQHVFREDMAAMLRRIPSSTKVWIDEAYVDYVGVDESLDTFAASSPNIIVCKSMSKCFALSGARVAYLCAAPSLVSELKFLLPPWSVSLLGQIAAVEALKAADYYKECYSQTKLLKAHLIEKIIGLLPWEITDGTSNFFLCHLPLEGPDAEMLVQRCRDEGLYIRNINNMGSYLNNKVVRIAVKDEATNSKMVAILSSVWKSLLFKKQNQLSPNKYEPLEAVPAHD